MQIIKSKPNSLKIKLILIFLGLKLVYPLQSFLSPSPEFNRMKHDVSWDYFLQVYSNNDSGWYEKIASNGYSKVEGGKSISDEYAFFPAYPLGGKVFSDLMQISPRISLLLISTACSILMILVFFSFAREYLMDDSKAFWSSLLVIIFPHHFYFSMVYSESLFLLSGIICFYALFKKNHVVFMIASSVLVLTRINGVLYLIPLVLFYNRLNHSDYFRASRYFIFMPMLISIGSYLLFLKIKFGSFLAFRTSAVHQYWFKEEQNPLSTLYDTLFSDSAVYLKYNAIYVIVFLVASFAFIKKRQYAFFALCFSSLILPLSQGGCVSLPRFISVLFPFSLLLGSWVHSLKWRNFAIFCLIILHLITFSFWNITHPFSF